MYQVWKDRGTADLLLVEVAHDPGGIGPSQVGLKVIAAWRLHADSSSEIAQMLRSEAPQEHLVERLQDRNIFQRYQLVKTVKLHIGYCDNSFCDAEAAEYDIPVSIIAPGDETRDFCSICYEAYLIGVQHGRAAARGVVGG